MSTRRHRGLPYASLLTLALVVWLLAPTSAYSVANAGEAPSTFDAPAIDHRDVGTVARPLRPAAPCTAAATSAHEPLTDGQRASASGAVTTANHGPPLYTLFRVYRL